MGWPGWALTLQRPILTWDTLVSGPAMWQGPGPSQEWVPAGAWTALLVSHGHAPAPGCSSCSPGAWCCG